METGLASACLKMKSKEGQISKLVTMLIQHLDFLEWRRRPKHVGQKTAFSAEELDLIEARGGIHDRTYRLTNAGLRLRAGLDASVPIATRCLIPDFDGAIFSQGWRDSLWDKFCTGAPRRQRRSVEQYKIVKRA
jgi:hypothetical protein